ncbi:MAG: helix-turn-helix domain-containing protein [Candidatus Sedimenticola endophacoides]
MNHPKFTCNHINQKQLADYWGISQRTLERWRALGLGPLFLKIGGRVVYRVEDILAYEEQHLAESTQSRVYR